MIRSRITNEEPPIITAAITKIVPYQESGGMPKIAMTIIDRKTQKID